MNNHKIVFVFVSLFLSVSLTAQTINALFDKYADNNKFRYVSISKGMINLATLFGKEDAGNDQMISHIEGMKVLTLKSTRNSAVSKAFFVDIEKVLSIKPSFQSLMEARENGVYTKVYNRTVKKNNADILIVSKSDSMQHFIWLNGSITTQQLQTMIKK